MSRESDLASKKKEIEDRLRPVCADMSEVEFQLLIVKVLASNSSASSPRWGGRNDG